MQAPGLFSCRCHMYTQRLELACALTAATLQGYMPWSAHGLDAARQQLGGRVHSPHHARSGTFSPQHQHPIQVLLRVRVVKPATHNTTAALQLNLEGLQLNAKTNGGDELLNLTVSTVQCALLNTTRERQLSLSVLSMQLDNQLLETRHPVVLSPATMGEVRLAQGCVGDEE